MRLNHVDAGRPWPDGSSKPIRSGNARLAAERNFDEAEKELSTGKAREGARKALKTYALREIATEMSEAATSELQDRCA